MALSTFTLTSMALSWGSLARIVPQVPVQPYEVYESAVGSASAIPGGSNFTYCSDDHASDLFQFSHLEISFYSTYPTLGGNATIEAEGTFSAIISNNAILGFVVEVDGLIGVGGDYFCNVTGLIEQPHVSQNQTCPPQKGKAIIHTDIPLDPSAPSGHWIVNADAYDGNGRKRIFCVRGEFDVQDPR